jgi:hypothetical protein
MDGSRFVPNIGVPAIVTSLEIPTIIPSWTKGKDSISSDFLSVAPVPLRSGNEYHYLFGGGMAQTGTVFIGDEKSSRIFASIPQEGDITTILTDISGVYLIHSTGCIEAYDESGKLRWHYTDEAFEVNPGNAILADSELIISGKQTGLVSYSQTGSNFMYAFNTRTGVQISSLSDGEPYHSIIFDLKTRSIFAAGDSIIICQNMKGACTAYTVFKERFHHPELRIISNLCLCGKNKDKIAFGYLSKKPPSDERTMNVGIFTATKDGHLQKVSSHEVPYLPINISSNGPIVLSSGFYDSGSELTSGIDAFYADDTIKLWQRRFTYPLVAPVAISERYAYLTLTFSTQAEVPAQSVFYTLDLTTGKTLGELPVIGAKNGFALGIPMPIGERGFVLADRNRPVLYFLKP